MEATRYLIPGGTLSSSPSEAPYTAAGNELPKIRMISRAIKISPW
jgi:hypothetical protein